MEFKLWITGDPILDKYWEGEWINYGNHERFVAEKAKVIKGGELNVFQNAISILSNKQNVGVYQAHHISMNDVVALTRLNSKKESVEYWEFAGNKEEMYRWWNPFEAMSNWWVENQGLIISDYNKGTVNRFNPRLLPEPCSFKFTLVDSRYRTLKTELLKNSQVTIWHATGSEWDYDWAQNFDYTIQTDGPRPVLIYKKGTLCSLPIHVPDTPVVDVTGAGDTFTAAIGAWLTQCYDEITLEQLTEASKFAIDCCQEVIQKKYCAVTTKKL